MEDFALWCEECVKITDKETGRRIPFTLNSPQRRVAGELERQRKSGKPIRVILLKARQWGGSTLIQAYMAWMQLVRREGWNSLVCAHVKDASSTIRGMYTGLLRDYPVHLKTGNVKDWSFAPYEKSASISRIAARDCLVSVSSAQAADSLRGGNYFMAHLSEAAFWRGDGEAGGERRDRGERGDGGSVIRAVCGSVPRLPETLVVIESTADGKGNYFHREWERAVKGESAFTPIFVPWHEIEIYSRNVTDKEWAKLLPELTDYELGLLQEGIAREKIAWYHDKRREYSTDTEMTAEFPGSPEEAFSTGGRREFGDDELPDLSDKASHATEREGRHLAVFCPGDGDVESVLTIFSSNGRSMRVEREEYPSGALPIVMERVLCASRGMELAIVEAINEDGISHAKWCARKAISRGAHIAGGEETGGIYSTDMRSLSEMTDVHHDLLHRGCISERIPEAIDDYRDFRSRYAWRFPRILNRLVAGEHLLGYTEGKSLDPAEFF